MSAFHRRRRWPALCLILLLGLFAPPSLLHADDEDDDDEDRTETATPEAAGNEIDEDEFQGLRIFPTQSPAIRRIVRSGILRVGVQRDYQPFHIGEARPGFPGIDPEIAESLAEAMGVRFQLVFGDIPELMKRLQENKIDIALGGISTSPERARYVRFTEAYLVSGPAALLSRRSLPAESESLDFNRTRLRNLGDLGGLDPLSLGVRSRTTTEQFLRKESFLERHRIRGYNTREAALAALLAGEIDALIADRIYLQALLLRRPDLSGAYLPLLDAYREEHLSIVLAQGDPEFAAYLNFFLRELRRTGAQAALQRRYLESREWLP